MTLQSIPSKLEAEWRILHFRLVLLRFTTLLLTRHNLDETTPAPAALAELRYRNRVRAAAWGENLDDVTRVFPEDLLRWYNGFTEKHTVLRGASDTPMEVNSNTDGVVDLDTPAEDAAMEGIAKAKAEPSLAIHDTPEETSSDTIELIDLIPMFIEMTAEYGARDDAWHTTDKWLELVADFMLQAALEKLLKHSCTPHIVEAFAWGIEGRKEERDGIAVDVNSVFCMPGEDANAANAAVSSFAWPTLRYEYLELLVPEGSVESGPASLSREDRAQATTKHLQQLAEQYPAVDFGNKLLAFLESLCQGYGRPLLAQLEDGKGALEIYGEEIDELDDETLRKLMSGR